VRNDGPGGVEGKLVPLAGVERAGGAKSPIECLRARIRALERVPVSLAFPPVPGTPGLACSLSSSAWQEDEEAIEPPHPLFLAEGGPLAIAKPAHAKAERQEDSPLDRLKQDGLHEIKAAAYCDAPAALAFALAVISQGLARRNAAPGLVLWCLTERAGHEWGRPYGPGLMGLGLDPARFLIVETRHARDAAWALEEGLKSRALIAALGQVEVKAPLLARRLGLAAKAGRTPCLLLSGHQATGLPGTGLPGTLTRWRVEAVASNPASFNASAPGAPCWQLTLERCRGMASERSWTVEWSDASYDFRLAAPFVHRAAEAGQSGASSRVRTG
jgi:protein ImuA